ncbi:xyloglucan endotransglucosylase/hydrolase protein 24-like [Carica papaya]|uniref:xyloglucan endotransglucosylase/hydrolase protein 24-like n=1 Tax=Carica papaya TaxID=3649 RepID=UPI000B8CA10D|nr:xyloglucan endotransglucosylase/hydrolase protein 24-like [Carica papaya]
MTFPSSLSSSCHLFSSAIILLLLASILIAYAGNFYQDVDIIWGDGRAKILNNGSLITLSLDKASGSGFQSKNHYLYGMFSMQIKLVPNNSAGTVTTFYLRSEGSSWDEIDFEFLGNLSGDPYILHSNIYTQGKGTREKQFYLWFDPTADFHTYSVLWNPAHIVFYVDWVAIRQFKNLESIGVPYPKSQPMVMQSTLWSADWATRGGRVRTNWTLAPFTASFGNYDVDGCVWCNKTSSSSCNQTYKTRYSQSRDLSLFDQKKLQWVEHNYMIYNYCEDTKRFPKGLPPECATKTES